MSHYKNGRLAHVGDPVVGKTYNRKGNVSGTLVSLTPGIDNCSAIVGFLEVVPMVEAMAKATAYYDLANKPLIKIRGDENHGSAGRLCATVYAEDYTHAGNLLHADDAMGLSEQVLSVTPNPNQEVAPNSKEERQKIADLLGTSIDQVHRFDIQDDKLVEIPDKEE
jgi:hypothetical protein